METFGAKDAQDKLLSLMERVVVDHEKFRISLSDGNAILLSEKNYDDLMITLELLSTPLLGDHSLPQG